MSYLTFQSMKVAGSGLQWSALEIDFVFREEEHQRSSENFHRVVSGRGAGVESGTGQGSKTWSY